MSSISNIGQNHPLWVEKWFSKIIESSNLDVSQIPFEASKKWSFVNGSLVHQTGRFFQVFAVQWTSPEGEAFLKPLLVQQEIGTLGFAINDHKILLQAKVEPGNVGFVQIAPTCQATASNLDRVHGGKKPPFAKFFDETKHPFIHSSLQSEQGTRFYKKFNKNILINSVSRLPADDTFQWQPIDALTEIIDSDFLINTDARSVLTTSPWEHLVKRKPFSRYSDTFSQELSRSYDDPSRVDELYETIITRRNTINKPQEKNLSDLLDWEIGSSSIRPKNENSYEIIHISVKTNHREVKTWDQPIISSFGEGYVELVCGRIDNQLQFLFNFQIEPGLTNLLELGPSVSIEPGEQMGGISFFDDKQAKVLLEVKQSDEGGRFYKDVTHYRLIDIGNVNKGDINEGIWLSLGQIRKLLLSGGWFTNEARSVISLLLKWL